jgi:hypothetical protein
MARAVVVTVEGAQWEISSFSGAAFDFSVGALDSRFNSPPGGVMPWWQNSTLANSFAQAYQATPGSDARFFAFSQGDTGGVAATECINVSTGDCLSLFESLTWASASLVPSPSVPGPLPILGAAAAFRASRRLRQRIPGSPTQV